MPKIVFIDRKRNRCEVEAPIGKTLLQIAHMHKIDLEGACDHSLACATCHVIIAPDKFDLLLEPRREELDMLDLAIGTQSTSRLACQIVMCEEYDGLVVTLGPA